MSSVPLKGESIFNESTSRYSKQAIQTDFFLDKDVKYLAFLS